MDNSSVDTAPVRMVDGELIINPTNRAFWDNPSLLAQYQHQSGFWSTADPSHVIFHETAHSAYYTSCYHFLAAQPVAVTYPEIITEDFARRLIDGSLTNEPMSRRISAELGRKILSEVSRHALNSTAEFVAEVFTGMLVGKTYGADVLAHYRSCGGPIM